ncbi:MAG: c-type cytochrome biogenesis protein CcmI [Gammaproteobacteria bacterium]|nr:c-type cytochrome biogenesis protein CcmI [Gammaproteobacteria bacterium]MDH5630422.1 c-type cytochrome biogenesis protein CcmI [Gammaproteobacteria bacterium]
MLLTFVLFLLISLVFLTPSMLFSQKQELQSVEESLSNRMDQLKQAYQQQTRELAKRLEMGDLDQEEWQQMTDELDKDTAASIASTQKAGSEKQIHPSVPIFILLTLVLGISAGITNYFTASWSEAERKSSILSALESNDNLIAELSENLQKKPERKAFEDLYLALRASLEMDINNTKSWRSLAMFYSQIGDLKTAVSAIQKAMALEPDNVEVKLELAKIYARTNHAEDLAESNRILMSVIKQNPQHEGALMMLGFNALNSGQFQQAIDAWTLVLKNRDPSSSSYKMLESSIEFAKKQLLVAKQHPQSNNQVEEALLDNKHIKVDLDISQNLSSKLSGNEVLFIFAIAENGPKFPVAVARMTVSEIPEFITLSDANAMQAEYAMSKFASVKVSAKISMTGNATDKTGDLITDEVIVKAPYAGQSITLTFK